MDNLEQAIAAAHQRWENLSQRASQRENQQDDQELLQVAMAEAASSLEELSVLVEELKEQNQELIATRYLVEAERQRYQDLFEFAPDSYLVTDVNGVIQEANLAAAQLLNVRPSYLLGKPLSVFVHPAEAKKFRQLMLQLQQQKQKVTAELRILHHQGKIDLVTEVTVALIPGNSQGRTDSLRWLLRDISDRLQAQQKIQEQAALLDMITDAIIVRDLQNQILYWNKTSEKIYGWRAEEVMGKNAWEILSPDNSPEFIGALETLLQHGSWWGELRKFTKFGKKVIIHSRWILMYDAAGLPISILSVDTDITEKKQLEIQLERAQRLESLGNLTSAIAHDLNNIFAPMITVAQLLPLKHPQLSESSLQMLKLLENNSKKGIDLVAQIDSFTRSSPRQNPTVSLAEILGNVQQTMKGIFPKNIEMDIDIPGNIKMVIGEKKQLHEVFIHILINFSYAMPVGAKLTISGRNILIEDSYRQKNIGVKVGEYVEIALAHTGINIDSQIMEEIFSQFLIAKTADKNTALDLSLDIINNYGGFVEISTELGKFHQLRIYLPSGENSSGAMKNQPQLPRGNGELILLVDEEAAITKITRTTLETHNYKVLIAENATEAITLYTQHQQEIKLVLIDMIISSMSGANVIRTLQMINPQIQVIGMSRLATAQALAEVTVTNMKGFLAKPFTAEEVLNSIHDVIAGGQV
jgi:two-component system, cell cycle sensor histidine kinase and response regulator CckA